MQKKIIALAVAALASTAAFAQTNVTVYGVADAYVGYGVASGQKNVIAVNSGGLSGSRLGFKGTEDLGNGLKALFQIEYGVNLDSNVGAATARQQMVGLTGGFGTAVVGYLQTTGYDFSAAANPIACSALDANLNVTSVGNTAALIRCTGNGNGRLGNAVAYISPTFGGVTLAINHARLSENTFADNQPLNNNFGTLASVSYAGGPVTAGLVYGKAKVNSTPAQDDWREYGLRAAYNFNVVSVFGSYQNLKAENSNSNNQWQLGVAVPVGKGTIVGQFAKNSIKSTPAKDNAKAFTVAYTYAMSKRTTAYGGISTVRNEAGSALGILNTPNPDGNATVYALGMRHSF